MADMSDCPVCGGTGLITLAPVHTQHELAYVAWSHTTVADCPRCQR